MIYVMDRQRASEIRADFAERRELGARLRQARKSADLTLEAVGEAIGIERQSVSAWENGRNYPTGDRLKKLASLYGVSIDWLLGNEMRIAEAPAAYVAGEPLPTEEEARLLKEYLRFLRWHRRRPADPL